jgi:uncharacterized protein (TIGR00297 family)
VRAVVPDGLSFGIVVGIAVGLAGLIALAAHRAGSLTRDGALAATLVGSLAMSAGTAWGTYLVLWFVSASLVSRLGVHVKRRRTASVLPPREARDAWQVLANGGVFTLLAAWTLWQVQRGESANVSTFAVMAASALAAAGADTLATEIGTWLGGTPRSLRNGRSVTPGTSGAVSLAGSLALLAGALGYAGIAAGLGLVPASAWLAVAIAASVGALTDSLLGAWLQIERWCPQCHASTEQNPHVCGTNTTRRRGWRALDNDGVNLLCTLSGAVTGGMCFALWH